MSRDRPDDQQLGGQARPPLGEFYAAATCIFRILVFETDGNRAGLVAAALSWRCASGPTVVASLPTGVRGAWRRLCLDHVGAALLVRRHDVVVAPMRRDVRPVRRRQRFSYHRDRGRQRDIDSDRIACWRSRRHPWSALGWPGCFCSHFPDVRPAALRRLTMPRAKTPDPDLGRAS